MARRGAVLLVSVVIGIAGGMMAGDQSTGVALGIAAGIGLEAAVLERE
jgi:hypothetical protein